ncbi:hypothetical protein [Jannaschia pohangensis]|uniref:Lipoprotein-attachment site-containing protein n=1 Tax=Jannaschia pohangensis TaxID=390807 RepID=A0A1I3QZU7_9RHOB|nr:hypothetical protein [Jannaschia pohangensis]SFJ38801.1 hypothetical protein SAMN04488095_2711 [Jannaschia pohangensis]
MHKLLKPLAVLPIVVLAAGCVANGDNRVDTEDELEATLDQDIDGDGTVPQSGIEVGTSG